MTHTEHFKKLGKHYGYPPCCINWFSDRAMKILETNKNVPLTPAQEEVNDNKGFIPCPECAERVANKKLTIEELIIDREHPYPYPNSNYNYVAKNVLHHE